MQTPFAQLNQAPCQNLRRINKEKGILIFGKNILRESKNVLVELLSKGEIDRIDEIK